MLDALTTPVGGVARLLAETTQPPGLDVTSLLQYGVLGIVVVALVFGRLVPWLYYNEKKQEIIRLNALLEGERASKDALRMAKDAELQTLHAAIDDRIIPLTIRMLDVVERRPTRRGGS